MKEDVLKLYCTFMSVFSSSRIILFPMWIFFGILCKCFRFLDVEVFNFWICWGFLNATVTLRVLPELDCYQNLYYLLLRPRSKRKVRFSIPFKTVDGCTLIQPPVRIHIQCLSGATLPKVFGCPVPWNLMRYCPYFFSKLLIY